jgi:uncharacterized protein
MAPALPHPGPHGNIAPPAIAPAINRRHGPLGWQTAQMSPTEAVGLFVAGIGGGLCGSIAGLASLVTYPALLSIGLSPVAANVTNTVALVCASAGSITGSGPELAGQRQRVGRLSIAAIVGGTVGAALLLLTPDGSFERIVPFLIALASVAILVRRRLVLTSLTQSHRHRSRGMLIAVGVVGTYAGYFGAGAGVMLLALMLFATGDTLARANAVKNVLLGVANAVAAVAFVAFGPVRWSVVVPLGAGLFLGGRAGPAVVRRSPATWLRVVIAIAGLGLAVKLGVDAYR